MAQSNFVDSRYIEAFRHPDPHIFFASILPAHFRQTEPLVLNARVCKDSAVQRTQLQENVPICGNWNHRTRRVNVPEVMAREVSAHRAS